MLQRYKIKTTCAIGRNNFFKLFSVKLPKLSENGGYGIDKINEWKQLTGYEVSINSSITYSEVIFTLPINANQHQLTPKTDESGGLNGGLNGGNSDSGGLNGGVNDESGGVNGGLNGKSGGVNDENGGVNGGVNGGSGGLNGGVNDVSGGVNGGLNDESGGVKLSDREIQITNYLIDHPAAPRTIISKELKIALRTLERIIAKLQKNKIIERVGSDKTGSWKVNL